MRYLGLLFALAVVSAPLAAESVAEWVPAPKRPSLSAEPGAVWFSPRFDRKGGTFKALYESMQDARETVTGDFLVARFRYTYDKPIGEDVAAGQGASDLIPPRHDESITEVLLDCGRHFSATASIRYLLNGNVVRVQQNQDGDILMMQIVDDADTTVGELCKFARERGAK